MSLVKALRPFVLVALAALAALPVAWAKQQGALASPQASKRTTAGVGGCAIGSGWGNERRISERRVLVLINTHRRRLGLQPLHVVRTLARAARWKALHMARFSYMAHDDPAPPVSRSAGSRIAACGFHGGWWGENIAYGYPSPRAVVQGWLNSPGHRANIENGHFRVTGIGAASRNGGPVFWSQTFGS
jgi:uncharacterized protein YkwD